MNKKQIPLSGTLMLMFLAIVATFNITLFMASEHYGRTLGKITTEGQDYSKLSEIITIIDKHFVGEYEPGYFMDGASAGIVDSLGDKWSGYYDAESYKQMEEASSNKYAGVGITINYDTERKCYVVATVSDGGPAQEAGIETKDIIKAVGSTNVSSTPQNELVNMVRGDIGTTVAMTITKPDGTDQVYTLTRKEIYTPDVTSRIIGDVGIIRIDAFDNGADKEFTTHLKSVIDKGVKGLVFDVRMNGGGYANVMANMLDQLLPEGTIISMTSKDGKTTEERSDADCTKLPMAVLANEYSISAAEFFAAAIQEYGVGTVVGEHTGGKGFAQTTIPLSDGSAVNISTYRYYTPKGNSLVETGVTPDVEVALTNEQLSKFYDLEPQEDTQLQKALEVVIAKIK